MNFSCYGFLLISRLQQYKWVTVEHVKGYGGVGRHLYKTELGLSCELIAIMNVINVTKSVKILLGIFN